MSIKTDFGKQVYQKRTQERLTQQELAELAEVSCRQIYNVEQGKTDLALTTAVRLVCLLDLSLDGFKPGARIDPYETLREK